jgi:ABC-type thiamin/hydroxymethylpyrimidine transport system permease subunit
LINPGNQNSLLVHRFDLSCSWQPTELITPGLYQLDLELVLQDSAMHTRQVTHTQEFSLDGSTAALPLTSVLLLSVNMRLGLILAFIIIFVLIISWLQLNLLFASTLHRLAVRLRTQRSKSCATILVWIVENVIILPARSTLLWTHFAYLCYLTVGPLFLGHIVGDSVGGIWLYAAYVTDTMIPSPSGMLAALLQLTTCVGPTVLAWTLSPRVPSRSVKIMRLLSAVIQLAAMAIQISSLRYTILSYGFLAGVLNPMELGYLIIQGFVLKEIFLHRLEPEVRPSEHMLSRTQTHPSS